MYKPLLINLQNEIDTLLDHVETDQFSREILQTQIMNILTETYNALNKLDECRIENEHLGKFENDRTSVQKYINHYQKQFDQAKEKEDKNLEFRHGFTRDIYEIFLINPEKALSLLRHVIASNSLYAVDPDVRVYEKFLSQHDPRMLFTTQRNYSNKDLFLNLYKRLEGYHVTREKILKSAGLKIFTFFNAVTKVQKAKLAKYIGYIFSTLDENDVSLDSKRAGSIKIIGEFEGFVLFDYLSNKKGDLNDFGMEEVFNLMIKNLVLMFKKQGNLAMVRRINNNRKMMEAALLAILLT